MKKLGIITVHYNSNYGAILQAYALQKKLCDLGYSVELINYINPCGKCEMKLFNASVVDNVRTVLTIHKRIRRLKSFKQFMQDNYKLSGEPIYNYQDLNENIFGYDVYITGSDQTFNLFLKGDINVRKTYFLPFVKTSKKISYAASMGESIKKIEENNKQWMKNALMSYDSLSVREEWAADFISSELNLDRPKVVVDPTMLLEREDWDNICKPIKYKKGSYILFYSVLSEPWIVNKVIKISKQLNLKVVAPHFRNRYELKAPFIRAEECGPGEFISLIKNAAFVCTSSFHGTVFSILYNKPFVSFIVGEGRRIKNLLGMIGLKDRMQYEDDAIDIIDKLNVDYQESKKIIDSFRKDSLDYLINVIGEE